MMTVFLKGREFIEKQSSLNVLFFIVAITFLCYINIFFGHEFIIYDDGWFIYKNKNVTNLSWNSIIGSFTGVKNGLYSPIAELYHAVIYFFFEKNPVAFKFFALLTHLLNVILVFKLFSYLSSNRWLVIFVSLVFAIHPMQVETIGWASVIFRIVVLFTLFGYLFYCKYLQSNYNWRYLAWVVFFYILAFLTKEQALLFPLGLVLINLKKGTYLFKKRIVKENILFGLMAVIFTLITVETKKTSALAVIERGVPFLGKIELLSETIITYLYNFLFPFNLSFIYPYPLFFVPTSTTYFRLFVALCIIVFTTIVCVKNKQYRFGIFWAFGFLSFVFTFSFYQSREAFMADRYIYFAIIGFAYTLFLILKKTQTLQLLGSLFIIMLITMTIIRVPVFKNSYTLFKDALNKNNKNHVAYIKLGYHYANITDEYNKAIRSYKKALALTPNNVQVHTCLAEVYFKTEKYEDALKYTSNALELSDDKIRFHGDMIEIYSKMAKYEGALKHAKIILKLSPDKTSAHMNLGEIYFKMKNYQEALKHTNIVLQLSPDDTKGYSNRIAVNSDLNRHEEAIKDLDYLLSKDPSNIKFLMTRAVSYFKQRNFNKSVQDCKKILSINDHEYAFYLLGHGQFLLNEYKTAEENLTKAIAMDDKKGNYYFFRSHSRLSLGKYNLAYEDVQNALKYKHPVSQSYYDRVANLAQK